MTKKIVAVLLAVFMVLSLTACKKDVFKFQLVKDDEYYAVSGVLDDKLEKAVIDSEYEGKPVIAILTRTFRSMKGLKEVHIPTSVYLIGTDAFVGCRNLEKVNYLGDVEDWVYIEFANDGANPTSYSRDLYVNDKLVTNLDFKKATKINGYAFFNCESITTLKVGETVGSIGKAAFANCINLTTATLSNNIGAINDSLFRNCQKLTSVTFGENIFSIDDNAFNGCVNLEQISTLKKITRIGDNAFYGCEKILSIDLPSTLTSIGENAFAGSGIKTINFEGDKRTFGEIEKVDGWNRGIEEVIINCNDGFFVASEFSK